MSFGDEMSKGKKKPKLRDYSSVTLTADEVEQLRQTMLADPHPISTAVLGAVMVEHELDVLLRRKFHRRDDDTWTTLTSENGPLRSFNAKIIAGYAFKLYDGKVKADLDVIREIRNAFAHSRKMLRFNDRLIIKKMVGAKLLAEKWRRGLQVDIGPRAAAQTYIHLCFEISLQLLMWRARAQNASNRRLMS